MEEALSRGSLRTDSFIRLRKTLVDGEPVLEIKDLGECEALLRNGPYLKQAARALIERGSIPDEVGWGGWLGLYQAALRRTALEELDRVPRREKVGAVRRTDKSHGHWPPDVLTKTLEDRLPTGVDFWVEYLLTICQKNLPGESGCCRALWTC